MKEIVLKVYSSELNKLKTVRIYLPKGYKNSNKSYPVLYMHDGQNLTHKSPYSQSSWGVIEALKSFNKEIIVVGVDSDKDREKEYCPYKPIYRKNKWTSNADKYLEFLINSIKPMIDLEYRTIPDREHTFLAGSSYGAVISVYASIKYKEIFSKFGIFSLASAPFFEQFTNLIDTEKLDKKAFYFVRVGTNEIDKHDGYYPEYGNYYLLTNRKFHEQLDKQKIKYDYQEVEGAYHSEKCWKSQFVDFAKIL